VVCVAAKLMISVNLATRSMGNIFTIFIPISFYSVGSENVINEIRSVKSGLLKTDKFEQKYLDMDW
jgi:hypothetical protein